MVMMQDRLEAYLLMLFAIEVLKRYEKYKVIHLIGNVSIISLFQNGKVGKFVESKIYVVSSEEKKENGNEIEY